MAKILITGGAGFIPGALAEKISADANDTIVLVDNLVTGSMKKVPVSPHKNIHFIKGDVNDFNDISGIFFAWKFDYVFHYAALVGVQRTLANPVKVLNDIEGIKNILNLSKNTGVKRIYFSSSSEVYGEPVQVPQNEHTTPLNSRLPYAIVKNLGEAFLRAYKDEYNLDFTVFRFFNTYGPMQSDDFVISRFLHAAMKGENITVYGDGLQTRTFCYIEDNVTACEKIFRENLYVNDVVNIGSDQECTILQLAETIIKVTGSTSQIIHLPPLPEGDMTRRRPDITKMMMVMKNPVTDLETGIKKIMESWRKN
ncbi:MAG: NAD-dependent epimerase/dehydratase family protein [Flavobacteriales bacterium]|nr:NAD-dependent epimerase/dehydratase family protein [Flavobacteriales bacterium]